MGLVEPGDNSFRFWRELAARDCRAAAATVRARIERLSPAQRRAMLAVEPPADELADEFARGMATGGPLAGVPFVVKDLFAVRGHRTGAGSTFLAGLRPAAAADAPLVAALRRAGAVYAGLTQLQEFAFGMTGENPHFGDCLHPRLSPRLAGGSSSGSAAAVAAGIVPLALGTDTAGSVRVPAAFCGLWAFRCRPRDPWIKDCFPLAPAFDTAGWFASGAADLREVTVTLLRASAGKGAPRRCARLQAADLAPDIAADHAAALDAAATAHAVLLPEDLRRALVSAAQSGAEAFAVLQNREVTPVHAPWLDAHRADYDPVVWARLDRARRRTAEEFVRAERQRDAMMAALRAILSEFDALVLPAAPFGALRKEECTEENRARLLRLTAPASLAGLPVASMPVALADGSTSGLQFVLREAVLPDF